jgi:Family of unknown function (DUF5946)
VKNGDHELAQYHELCAYTLGHPGPSFIHQHVVDAFAAQRADAATKPITLTFALIGLYLLVERKQTGRQVQRVHMLLARRSKQWPTFALPKHRGDVTVGDVVGVPPGPDRDRMIDAWCASVWEAYAASHGIVIELIQAELR